MASLIKFDAPYMFYVCLYRENSEFIHSNILSSLMQIGFGSMNVKHCSH